MSSNKTRTVYAENVIPQEQASALYAFLKDSIPWRDGVRSKHGFTRKAFGIAPIDLPTEYPHVLDAIVIVAAQMGLASKEGLAVGDVYLNYYRDGEDYTPSHSHPHSKQLVISLGASRNLVVGKKTIRMTNGSAVVFGSSMHGVPKDPLVGEGRISIAVFCHEPKRPKSG